ncbi:DMT family transporter [Puniceibacterium confluentis]|uniref:DMT family transporter n=1 Tax=Puniceibacterium confluentis TaxID=1958944 RepID=UPI0011B5C4F7|nr:DMT family transporter [Puniceibacterium confluentis]
MKSPVALIGAALVALYTLTISAADGITKLISQGYAAPQLFALSAAMVLALSWGASRMQRSAGAGGLRTRAPRAMALRAGLTVLACVGFFKAFQLLPFADVFLFIGLMPVIAALLSGPALGEPLRREAVAALGLGTLGLFCLLPGGLSAVQPGHAWALMAALTGTGSMLCARYIGRIETNALAQVFYPNLAILVVMGAALPFVWRPMGLADLGWIAAYALFLFAARWIVTVALRLLPAYVATALMNLQFVWMVLIGFVAFGEVPNLGSLTGVALVIASGLWLVFAEHMPRQQPTAARA